MIIVLGIIAVGVTALLLATVGRKRFEVGMADSVWLVVVGVFMCVIGAIWLKALLTM